MAHCFQGSQQTAQTLIERGFMIGVDAPITYPAASSLRVLMAQIPLISLVLETDSPYLPPQSHRGKRNEPTHIPAIARALADIKQVSLETIAAVTTDNAKRLFQMTPA
ncbi:MAG: TatD family hydrolase [Elusimicrobia bacterium]|nr:TatD family hydrolase [Elusimicrobiota bacterium]